MLSVHFLIICNGIIAAGAIRHRYGSSQIGCSSRHGYSVQNYRAAKLTKLLTDLSPLNYWLRILLGSNFQFISSSGGQRQLRYVDILNDGHC
jgi:hypothetical protein